MFNTQLVAVTVPSPRSVASAAQLPPQVLIVTLFAIIVPPKVASKPRDLSL